MSISEEGQPIVLGDGERGDSNTASTSRQPSRQSPNRPSKYIQAGDLVIIYISRDKPPVPLTVLPGQELHNTYGTFSHDNIIGLPFGAKVGAKKAAICPE